MFRKKQKKKGVEDTEGKRLRDILDSMIDGVTILDMNGKIIEINRSTLLQHGYTTKEEILGKTPAEVFIDKKDIPKFVNTVEKILTGEQVLAEEYQARRKDGTLFTASVNVSLLKDIQGNPKAIIAVHRDITERKQAEEALQKAYDDLEKKVDERTEELWEKLNELERFREATLDREFRIKELQEELERLKEEKGSK